MTEAKPRIYRVQLPVRYLALWAAMLGFLTLWDWLILGQEYVAKSAPIRVLFVLFVFIFGWLGRRYVVMVLPDRIESTAYTGKTVFRDATLRIHERSIGLPLLSVRGMTLSNYGGFFGYLYGSIFIPETTSGYDDLKRELLESRPAPTDFVLEDQSNP
ncbi:MAG TPA: hypothetical protein VLA96_10955 [Terriglobales bacterium]|nr:hypothetical protein [Terriglobales bacterium]